MQYNKQWVVKNFTHKETQILELTQLKENTKKFLVNLNKIDVSTPKTQNRSKK